MGTLSEMNKVLQCANAPSEMQGIEPLLDAGAKLGKLWMEGYFEFGDPLTNAGGLKRGVNAH